MNPTRRELFKRLALLAATPYALSPMRADAGLIDLIGWGDVVFSLSVASGDPTDSGVMLWTRINPPYYDPGSPLQFEIARDVGFTRRVAAGSVDAADFGPGRDCTVRLDTTGLLEPGQRYFYRFRYRGAVSRIGRCATLPAPGADLAKLRLGVVTCQDFTNGYYPAFAHLAEEDLDFVVHLGDFIYETTDDARFQHPLPGRALDLPSGATVAQGLADYRAIYRAYRSDRHFQRALEAHTWIVIWDDHEFANDCYFDPDTGAPAAPDHPFSGEADAAARLTSLKLDSQQAWAEYVPARVEIDLDSSNPLERLSIYRSFRFGRLAELFLTDQRSYRNGPPCGLGDFGARLLAPASAECAAAAADPTRTMLGAEQKAWLVNGLANSTARWKIWGNEVQLQPLKIGLSTVHALLTGLADPTGLAPVIERLRAALPGDVLIVNLDAWDGYAAERRELAEAFQARGVTNLIALTGDFHTCLAGYLKRDYDLPNRDLGNRVGVEFMTPALTSANLKELVAAQVGNATPLPRLGASVGDLVGLLAVVALNSATVRLLNNSIEFFDSAHWGYSVLELTRGHAEFSAYAVDKSRDAVAGKRLLVRFLAEAGVPNLVRTDGLGALAEAGEGEESAVA